MEPREIFMTSSRRSTRGEEVSPRSLDPSSPGSAGLGWAGLAKDVAAILAGMRCTCSAVLWPQDVWAVSVEIADR